MAVEPDQRTGLEALAALADGAAAAARASRADEALTALAAAAARGTGAEAAVVRVRDPRTDELVARGFFGSVALAAQVECSRVPLSAAQEGTLEAHLGAGDTIVVPADGADGLVGTLELHSPGAPLDTDAQAVAQAAAAQLSLVLRLFAAEAPASGLERHPRALALVGEALAAGAGAGQAETHIVRIALELAGCEAVALWRLQPEPEVVASAGALGEPADARPREAALRAFERGRTDVEEVDARIVVSFRLADGAAGVLQLSFDRDAAPSPAALEELTVFATRAAHALRVAEETRRVASELERTGAVLAAVAAANEQLSLAHAVETAIDRVREIVGAERTAVYLRDDDGALVPAAAPGLVGPHAAVAQALLALALGPFRARGLVAVPDAAGDERLRDAADAVLGARVEAAVALPLLVGDETIGLLAAFPDRGYAPDENEERLLTALAGQLAVVVQNARLHDRATALGSDLEQALESERDSARRLRALYEISRSFTSDMSLDATLDAVVETVVEHLDVDAAVIRLPDPRRELLVPHAMHVADKRVADTIRPLLFRTQQLSHPALERVFRTARPMILDGETAPVLAPFLEKGSTAAVFPIARSAETIAMLTVLSLRPDRPIDERTVEAASAITAQAALAIDNARLYQQQKDFADAMQRSLLPSVRPAVRGLDVFGMYAGSAEVEVGGDLYDFVALADGRVAVVIADVTGHGIDAAADMAMAKFVFRTLVREHPEPSDFLRTANQVVVDEIAPGKFITMLYLVVDPETGVVTCGAGGHPPPRLVRPNGVVTPIGATGLALGIDGDQTYEEVTAQLDQGGSVVLYTDGVIEARVGSELYGFDRLDALLARRRDRGADEIAGSVIEAARKFTGGELMDDCAVVVVKRT